ncbi:uncharacterized protein LOC130803998 isoform X4 [Amaranthus tricolor]|uniref:uncharacterized protein LOC130803998 isoform X4 n=1 Tax=Amaranthus tricolor TaxID=29722 RepID=UPI00258D5A8B|nr:uncharacterized protein LOC130803998 isoform X4 [Amaranthus tricolor]
MSTNLRVGVGDGGWSEEYDCVPLRLRLKMLHLIKHQKEFVKVKSEPQTICGCFAESETVTEKQLIQSANCSSMVLFAKDLELRIQQASDSRADRYEECPKDYGLSQFENCFISSSKVLASEAQADTEQLKDLAGASLHRTTSDVPHNILQDCLMSYTSESGQASDVKQEIFYDFDDTLDNILLKERRKMLLFRKFMESSRSNAEEQDDGGLSTFSKVMLQSAGNDFIRDVVIENNIDHEVNGYENLGSEIATDGTFHTSNDSVETALEEDAPGLLKVLLDRGVLAEEIKLYGEANTDDALDDSIGEVGFAELEAVISQLFWQRQTFLKFPHLRSKGAKIDYCLSCLLSLVEQTRYLRNKKWPIEWGWCRDLQSFIFVFQRHNRIVLERPEYGFATYFFELLNSVPVAWQIKRLVTAMKLTSCGRITLIENRPLVVGEDLSEGEAQVLADYGWTPNTGLGTMLNYCDRVFHDRKQQFDSSEWRLKIGRQLMDGYNGGSLVAKNLPKRFTEYQDSHEYVQVKTEESAV